MAILNFNPLSKFFGSRGTRHIALLPLTPYSGDYEFSGYEQDSSGGTAVAYAQADVPVDPRTGLPVVNYVQLPTFMASMFATNVASGGVLAQLKGAANVKARVSQVVVSGHFTAVTAADVVLYKCSTAVTGGTTATEVVGNFDSADAANACTATMYSTPGTIGSIIDILGAQHRIFGTASAIGDGPALMNWPNGGEFPTLNNANEYFCVALLNAASYAGANFSVNMEWTENTY